VRPIFQLFWQISILLSELKLLGGTQHNALPESAVMGGDFKHHIQRGFTIINV